MEDEIPFYYENRAGGDSFINKAKRVATSSLLFIVAFILSNLLLQTLIAQIAKSFKYTVRFTYNQVTVLPYDYHYWSRPRVLLIYFISPLICLAIGLFIFNLLRVYSTWANVFRMFLFWLAVVPVNMILTHILISPLGTPTNISNGLYQTFAVIGAWLYLNPAIMVMAAIASLVTSLFVGMVLRNEIMRYSFSKKLIQSKKGMDAVVIQLYILPVIFGIVPILMLCTPISFFTIIMEIINLAIISIGIFMMNSISMPDVRCNKDDVLNHFPVVELGICSVVWFLVFAFLK